MSPVTRNTIGTLFVTSIYLLLPIGPDCDMQHAEAFCGDMSTVVGTFDNMNLCVDETKRVEEWKYCGCRRPANAWAPIYFYFVVPIGFALAAAFALSGPLVLRVGLLSCSVLIGGFLAYRVAKYTTPMIDAEAPAFWAFYVMFLFVSANIGLLVVNWTKSRFRRW